MANKAEFKQDLGRTVNLNYLAQLHCSKNEFDQAEKLYKEVLDIVSAGKGENDPELIMSLHRLGLVCRILEKFPEAEAYYKRAYLLAMQSYKLDDVRIASRANFLAGLYNAMEQYNLSEIMLRHSQILYEKAFGRDSQQVEFALMALALVVRFQGDSKKADALHQESLEVGRRKKKSDSSKQAQELASLAQKFYGMEQYAEAETLFRYALIIGEENFWPDHPFVIEAFQKVGEWHLAQESYTGAVDFLEQAALRSEKLHGQESHELVNVYEKYFEALEKNKDPKAAAIKVKLINLRPVPTK
jgi:tetratricopeptide (TPR) repeat protein